MLAGGVVVHPPKRFALQLAPQVALFNSCTIVALLSSREIQRYYPRLSPTPDRAVQNVRAAFLGQLTRWLPKAPPPPPVPPLSLALVPPVTCVTVRRAQCNAPAERAGSSSLQAAWAAHPFPIRRCPCSSPHPTCLCRQHAGRQPSERSFWEAWSPLLDAHTTEEALLWVGALEAARPGSSSVECYFGAWGSSPQGSQVHPVAQPALSCRWLWAHSAAWDASIMACHQQLKRCRA